jgi:acyl-[acyl-carrier-protein]-phospholipid O-acyltransferase/long-chain-fatty-acid--[acyl-carrier-protein] ligase
MCNKLLKGKIDGRLVPFGSLCMSIFILDFCFASDSLSSLLSESDIALLGIKEFFMLSIQSWRVTIDLLLIAISAGIYIVPLYAIMQHRSDKHQVARVIAGNNLINALFMLFASGMAFIFYAMDFKVTDIIFTVGIINILVFSIIRRIVKKRLNNA